MSWIELEIGPFSHVGVNEKVIKNEPNNGRYERHSACNKTSVSDENKKKTCALGSTSQTLG